jgi:hypothetical protein
MAENTKLLRAGKLRAANLLIAINFFDRERSNHGQNYS